MAAGGHRRQRAALVGAACLALLGLASAADVLVLQRDWAPTTCSGAGCEADIPGVFHLSSLHLASDASPEAQQGCKGNGKGGLKNEELEAAGLTRDTLTCAFYTPTKPLKGAGQRQSWKASYDTYGRCTATPDGVAYMATGLQLDQALPLPRELPGALQTAALAAAVEAAFGATPYITCKGNALESIQLCFAPDSFGAGGDAPKPIDCPWKAPKCPAELQVPAGTAAGVQGCDGYYKPSKVDLKSARGKAAAAAPAAAPTAAPATPAGPAAAAMALAAAAKQAAAKEQAAKDAATKEQAAKDAAAKEAAAKEAAAKEAAAKEQAAKEAAAKEASDKEAASKASETTAASTNGEAVAAPTTTTSDSSSSGTSTGLMIGALMGGIAGGVLLGVAVFGGGYYWWLRRRRTVAAGGVAAGKRPGSDSDLEKGSSLSGGKGGKGQSRSGTNSASSWSDGEGATSKQSGHSGPRGGLASSGGSGSFTMPPSPSLPRRGGSPAASPGQTPSGSFTHSQRSMSRSPIKSHRAPSGSLRRTTSDGASLGSSSSLRRVVSDGAANAAQLRSFAIPGSPTPSVNGSEGRRSMRGERDGRVPALYSSRSMGGGWTTTDNPLGNDGEPERSTLSARSLASLASFGSSSMSPQRPEPAPGGGSRYMQRTPSGRKFAGNPAKSIKYAQPAGAPRASPSASPASSPAKKPQLQRVPSKLDQLYAAQKLAAVDEKSAATE